MGLLAKTRAYARVLPRARRNRTDLLRYLVRRPALLAAVSTYEAAIVVSNRLDPTTKTIAGIRASSRIGCPF
jgi:hypothetical protein